VTKIAERHLPLTLEIEMLPNSLVITESTLALILEIFIPVTNSSTVSCFLIPRILVSVFEFHILLMLLKFLFQSDFVL